MKELSKRSISGLLFASVLLGAVAIGSWGFAFLFGIFSVFILREFYQLAKATGVAPQKKLGLIIGGVIFVLSFLHVKGIFKADPTAIFLALFFIVPVFELYRAKKNSLENIAITLFGILYISLPFSLYNLIVFPDWPHSDRYTPQLLVFVFFLIWAFDSGAYLFGVAFGKHRLFERISPKKSWEGFFGGWFLALVFAVAIHLIFHEFKLDFMLLFATIISITSTFGDLVESMIKRNIGIKDSGKFLPGHGGLLDRFDSIIYAAPFVYLLIQFVR